LETVKTNFKQVVGTIQKEDLAVTLKFGVILKASFGSLLALRKHLETSYDMVYITISSAQLYLVHWNDLSPEKQAQLMERGKIHESRK